jgi:hypothetical protein
VREADNLPPFCTVVMKSRNHNFLEPSGSLLACNGTDLPLRSINTGNKLHFYRLIANLHIFLKIGSILSSLIQHFTIHSYKFYERKGSVKYNKSIY